MTTWDEELSGVALAMQLVASPRVCQILLGKSCLPTSKKYAKY
jgi:hypothetical protein